MLSRNYVQDAKDALVVTRIREQFLHDPRPIGLPPIPNNAEGRKYLAEVMQRTMKKWLYGEASE